MLNVLFLCTGNSARSIMAEVILNEFGSGRFKAYSAGSHPKWEIHPGALKKLAQMGHSTEGLHSKSWDRFSGAMAPSLDIVITVCDKAAGESCPVWHGSPVRVDWSLDDPAAESDDLERSAAFDQTYAQLEKRIMSMMRLPDLEPSMLRLELERLHHHAAVAES